MRKQRKQQGFSLIELLIVVAIILIIAAIAIPNLVRAKMSANESSAVASIRSIGTAQVQYTSTYTQVGFATSLIVLGTGTSSTPPTACGTIVTQTAACLVDGVLTAGAGIGKSGYFIDTTGIVAGTVNATFVSQAGPIKYNSTGLRMFCAEEDGILHGNTNVAGGSGLPGVTYPVCQLAAAPWDVTIGS
jgi:prepilin-type N-terminal cleavage/methylation domain-containing protein